MSSLPAWPCPLNSDVLYDPPVANSYVVSCNTNYPGSDLSFLHADTLTDCLHACDTCSQDSSKANGAACVAVTFGAPSVQNNCYLKYAATSVLSVSSSSNMHSARRQGYGIGQGLVMDTGQLGAGSDSVASTIIATDSAHNNNAPPTLTSTLTAPQASSIALAASASVSQPTQSTSSTTVVVYQAAPSASFSSSATSSIHPAVALALSGTHTEPLPASTPKSSPSNTRTPALTKFTSPAVTVSTTTALTTSTPSSALPSFPSLVPEMRPQDDPHRSSGTSLALKLGLAISVSSVFTIALLSFAIFMYFRHRRRRRISIPRQLPPTALSSLYPIPPPVPPPKNYTSKPRSMHELGTPFTTVDAELNANPIKSLSTLTTWKRPRTLAKAELEAPGALGIKELAELPGWIDYDSKKALEDEKRLEATGEWNTGKITRNEGSVYRDIKYDVKRDHV